MSWLVLWGVRTGNACWDDNHVGTGEGLLHAIIRWEVSFNLLQDCFSTLIGALAVTVHLVALTAIEEMWDRSIVTPGVLTTS